MKHKLLIVKKVHLFLLLISFLLLLPNFLPFHLQQLSKAGYSWEAFNPNLTKSIRSMAQLEKAVDALAVKRQLQVHDTAYGNIAARLVRERFYHGYSHYALDENWIAALAGRVFWFDLSAIVLTDDILKYPMAACSQQSIVMMEFFRRKGILCRKVGLNGHYALECKLNSKWFFFDTNKEPKILIGKMGSVEFLKKQGYLPGMYETSMDSSSTASVFAKIEYGKPGAIPAPNASVFHQFTKILSSWLWLAVLSLWMLLIIRDNKQIRAAVTSNQKKY